MKGLLSKWKFTIGGLVDRFRNDQMETSDWFMVVLALGVLLLVVRVVGWLFSSLLLPLLLIGVGYMGYKRDWFTQLWPKKGSSIPDEVVRKVGECLQALEGERAKLALGAHPAGELSIEQVVAIPSDMDPYCYSHAYMEKYLLERNGHYTALGKSVKLKEQRMGLFFEAADEQSGLLGVSVCTGDRYELIIAKAAHWRGLQASLTGDKLPGR